MDFYLNAPPCVDRNIRSNPPSAHYIVLLSLDLATAIFLDEEDRAQIRIGEEKKHVEKSDKKQKVTKAISSLLIAAHSLACSLLTVSATGSLISNPV